MDFFAARGIFEPLHEEETGVFAHIETEEHSDAVKIVKDINAGLFFGVEDLDGLGFKFGAGKPVDGQAHEIAVDELLPEVGFGDADNDFSFLLCSGFDPLKINQIAVGFVGNGNIFTFY